MKNISAALKNSWIRQLHKEWTLANYYYFGQKMRAPDIDLSASETAMGAWEGGMKRRLSISIRLIESQRWQLTQEVLHHEMAHQYIEEVMKITDAPPHGDIFKKICAAHSIDPLAEGSVDEWERKKKCGTNKDHKILNRIQKLFSLAQSNNHHEAELAMTKARELLLRHNISLMDSPPDYTHRQIGNVGRKSAIRSLIAGIVQEFFFVETLWGFGYDPLKDKSGRVLEVFGREESVQMAEYVYFYLMNIVESLWKKHKSSVGIKGDQNRRTYIYGLLHGFYEKLSKETRTTSEKGELILKEDAALLEYCQRKRPKTSRSSLASRSRCDDTYRSGFSRGKTIVIHKGVSTHKQGNLLLSGQER